MKEVVIYTKPGCPYCAAVKELFNSLGVEYKEINFFSLSDSEREELMERTGGYSSAPMVFIGGVFYKGYEDVKRLKERGELNKILEI